MDQNITIGVGLYGSNHHQVGSLLPQMNGTCLRAVCKVDEYEQDGSIRVYEQYEDLLADPTVDLVSICSPFRARQADEICQALQAGKHVYAEKPCVMTMADLDRVLTTAQAAGREILEMAGTAYEEPYATARNVVQSGILGTIVQVFVQKSYPMADWRPQDENVDGGLIMQVGIHAARMIEHVAGQRVTEVAAIETGLGNPKAGGLKIAASLSLRLASGGVAAIIANYLNQAGIGVWGNEELRIFGTEGFLTTDVKNLRVTLVNRDGTRDISCGEPESYLQQVIDFLRGAAPRPMLPAIETHPTRIVIRAKESAERGGIFLPV